MKYAQNNQAATIEGVAKNICSVQNLQYGFVLLSATLTRSTQPWMQGQNFCFLLNLRTDNSRHLGMPLSKK